MNARRIIGWPVMVACALMVLATFSACDRSAEKSLPAVTPAGTAIVTDGAGREVSLAAEPQRIISISPAATDILMAEGAHAQIIGATRFCVIPAADENHITRIGGMMDPDYERIVALRPDLVVIPWLADKTLQDKLISLGLPVLVLHAESLAGVLADMRLIGQATGHAGQGEAKAGELEALCALVAGRWQNVSSEKRPRVLMYLDEISPAPGAYVDDLLTAAGGRNVLPHGGKAWVEVSPESALQLAPDLIIKIPSAGQPLDTTKELALFKSIKVVTLDNGAPFYHPGPDLGVALWLLARAIDPTRFPEAQPPTPHPEN